MITLKICVILLLVNINFSDLNEIKDETINLTHLHEVIETSSKSIKKKPYAILTLEDQDLLKDSHIVESTTKLNISTSVIKQNGIKSTTVKNFLISPNYGNNNVFKVPKSKSKVKGRELLKKEELHKNMKNQYNSVNQFLKSTAGNHSYLENWNLNENLFQILVNLYDHFYWQPIEIRSKVSTSCGTEILGYLSALNSNYEWAQKAYDSSGHYRAQLLFGGNVWIGEKQFCLEINHGNEISRKFNFSFFVARVSLKLALPTNLTTVLELGECLPSSCTPNDIQTIFELDPHYKLIMASNSSGPDPLIEVLSVRRVPGNYDIMKDLKFRIFSGITISLILVICYATWLESYFKPMKNVLPDNSKTDSQIKNEVNGNGNGKSSFELYQMNQMTNNNNNVDIESNDLRKITKDKNPKLDDTSKLDTNVTDTNFLYNFFICFSFSTNASNILKLSKPNENTISCVHGIRVLSLLWIILVHTYLMLFRIAENPFVRVITERVFTYQIIGNATFSVDSFFCISGILVALIFMKKTKQREMSTSTFIQCGIFQSFYLFIYRFIRLTPAYLFVIFFNDISIRYVVNSAVFTPAIATEACSAYWWRNILYINNFYPFEELCMIWSWYLANDFQFYVIAIILLILSTRYMKASVITLFTLLLISWGSSGILSIHFNYTHKVRLPFESFDFLYDKPWQRIGSYIIGMITGYAIFKIKNPPKLPKTLIILLWLFCVGLLFSLIFGVWSGELSMLTTAFYVSIGHTAWGIGIAGIVIFCCWGYSPTVNKILSYEGFLPLSRVTYCAYLVHPVIMILMVHDMEGPIHLNNWFILIMFCGNAVISFIVAFIISVMFEAPVIRLLKLVFKN